LVWNNEILVSVSVLQNSVSSYFRVLVHIKHEGQKTTLIRDILLKLYQVLNCTVTNYRLDSMHFNTAPPCFLHEFIHID